jgi:hypothetical protein
LSVDTGGQSFNKTAALQQAMADNFGVGGVFAQSASKELGQTHNGPLNKNAARTGSAKDIIYLRPSIA